MCNHRRYQRCDTLRCILFAKIECARMPEHFAQDHDRIHVSRFHLFRFVAGQKVHFARQCQHGVVIIGHGRQYDGSVVVNEFVRIETSRAEID